MRKSAILTVLCIATILFTFQVTAKTIPADPYKESLESLQNKVPLSYNESVRRSIESYTAQKKRFGEMLGLSKYYFPIYEKVFHERNIPEEIKYLSIVESSLNSSAVSRAGAAGPWQFMYEIGKLYGLTVNDTIDERRDPALAANAAASYLLDSYNMYGDWLLAIASYNCGRNRIRWAMEDSGGQKDYWAIRKYLPEETQNYIPAFIATVYVMNNYQKHDIYPEEFYFKETELIPVKNVVSFADISVQTGVNLNQLTFLNPSYIQGLVNATESSPKNLIIPVLPTYTYNTLCRMVGAPERLIPEAVKPAEVSAPKVFAYFIMYSVQEGDNMSSIAGKFSGASENDIKAVNNLESSVLTTGMTLKIPQG